MGVKTFAVLLIGLGVVLLVVGWWAWNPVGFVGAVLIALGAVVRMTRPRDGESR